MSSDCNPTVVEKYDEPQCTSNEDSGQKRKSLNPNNEGTKSKKMQCLSIEEKKINNLRRNIRDVMNEHQLDTNTLEAQRKESERLARVADQQKSIREIQKQIISKPRDYRYSYSMVQKEPVSIFDKKNCDETKFVKEICIDIEDTEKSSDNLNEQINERKPIFIGDSSLERDDEQLISGGDVVTIEDSSSDDDCILLSEEEDFNETDDGNNSGMHVNDTYNMPDELGRVVVNIGHPEGEKPFYLAPQIAKVIKPHQIGGVRFLYDNIIESTKRFNKSSGFGCILAHSMGLGKTLQVVSFCDIFLRHTSAKSVLCVMPINTLQNWLSEFNMWIPRTSVDENIRARNFEVFVLNDQQKTLAARAKVILNWAKEGGVLLIGYELFRLLALKLISTRKKVNKTTSYINGANTHADLMDNIQQALVKPGPDLVICDEGHRIKNSNAGISQALKQIKTRRRIVLTGYPLQNNLLEYWCMVDFVRPNYLGSRTEFCNMFERPIQNGQCVDSTPDDIKLMRYRAHVLHSLLVGFVQRRSHEVLHKTLPKKLEYVILVRMTPFQRSLYNKFMTDVVRKKAFPNPLKAFAVCCKIWNHPDVLYNFVKEQEIDLDLEIDDDTTKNSPTELKSTDSVKEEMINSMTANSINNTMPVPTPQSPLGDINNKIIESQHIEPSFTNNQTGYMKEAYGELNKRNDLNLNLLDDGSLANFGPYSTNGKPMSFWHDTAIPCKPSYIKMMMPQSGVKNEMENVTVGSSEIVDLDTNEIKTVESEISNSEVIQHIGQKSIGEPESNALKVQENYALNKKDFTKISNDAIKKITKPKRCDEFSCTWAMDLMKNYELGQITNSPKMEIFFCILRESISLGDRILLFSQSLLTLNLIERFLMSTNIPNEKTFWIRNRSYFRIDGSTTSQEREKLVNEFNANISVKLFLISTRAGSLGINLTGANRVIIFDASWNPCHDTQAVYRIYRYGQRKPCFIYRLVMDKCLEKKIYDRQIKKQGMADRVVDECNPEAHLSLKDVTNLCHDYDSDDDFGVEINEESKDENNDLSNDVELSTESQNCQSKRCASNKDFNSPLEIYEDVIINKIIQFHKTCITKNPFFHESLLVDRKDRQLSQAEKRQAHRSYEMEKKASVSQKLNYTTNRIQYKIIRNDGIIVTRPVASIRPIQAKKTTSILGGTKTTRWIPAEVWQRQGMTAQEMTLPLDVVIPTNSAEKTNIILKSGQRVMVLKSSKGIYMQLESGKIIAIRTTAKMQQEAKDTKGDVIDISSDCESDVKPTDALKESEKRGIPMDTPLEENKKKAEKKNIEDAEYKQSPLKEIKSISDKPECFKNNQTNEHKHQKQQQMQNTILQNQPPSSVIAAVGSATPAPSHQYQFNNHQPYVAPYNTQYQHHNSYCMQPIGTPFENSNNFTECTYLPHREITSYNPQYYDYYNSNSHYNYPPYHSHLYTSTPPNGYGDTSLYQNAYSRPWNSGTNSGTTNGRLQTSQYIENGMQPGEWSSQ